MNGEIKIALMKMGYRPLGDGSRMWAKPLGYQLVTYEVAGNRLISWFANFTTKKPETFDWVSVENANIKDAEASILSTFSPWRGAWQTTNWDFLDNEQSLTTLLGV